MTLSGTSKVVESVPYILTVHLPNGFKIKSATVSGGKAGVTSGKDHAKVRVVPASTGKIDWRISFAR